MHELKDFFKIKYMKTLLFICLLLLSIASQAQTTSSTTTQNAALKAFEDAFITTDWSAKTTTEQDAFNRQWTGLKIASVKEAEANRLAEIAAQTAAEQAQQSTNTLARNEFITKLQSLGYACDNGQTDWRKLYNRPELFSSTWQTKADYQQSISPNLDYFLEQTKQILFMPYEIGKSYKIGDTFFYFGEYYKVIQAHVSQITWRPNEVPALYIKVVGSQTIAEWVQPVDSSDVYKIGDKVTFNGSTYESLIDANVWSPTVYPAGWKKL